MKIAFFTEMDFVGKIPRIHKNMRTEFAWMCALDATHYPLGKPLKGDHYDLGIIIIPKKNPRIEISHIKLMCDKVAIMQEGPSTYFQDYPLVDQINYLNLLMSVDILFVHNRRDSNYLEGLTGHKDVRILRTLMIEDSLKDLPKVKRDGVIIGGNFVSWYGGMDSYIVARELEGEIFCPSMGRKVEGEEQLVTHLPYLPWTGWMRELNKFKIGVHLMRTQAAGTFSLNCAYLGIPCIGYRGLDTQEICHPNLTVEVGDLIRAKYLIKLLDQDKEYYNEQSKIAKDNYTKFYHEDKFYTPKP